MFTLLCFNFRSRVQSKSKVKEKIEKIEKIENAIYSLNEKSSNHTPTSSTLKYLNFSLQFAIYLFYKTFAVKNLVCLEK